MVRGGEGDGPKVEVERFFSEVYGEDYDRARKSSGLQDDLDLAKKLLEDVRLAREQPALGRLMLERAFELASRSPLGLALAETALRRSMDEFGLGKPQALPRLEEVLRRRVSVAVGEERSTSLRRLLETQKELAQVQRDAGDHEAAGKTLQAAKSTARLLGDRSAGEALTHLADQVRVEQEQKRALEALQKKLAAAPDDPAINEQVGLHFLLQRGDAAGAAGYLCKGPSSVWRSLVMLDELERAGKLSPDKDLLRLADYYSQAAAKAPPETRARLKLLERAEELTSKLLETKSAPVEVKLRTSALAHQIRPEITKLEKMLGLALSPGLVATYFRGQNFEQKIRSEIVKNVDFFWEGSPAPGVPADEFSIRYEGFLILSTPGHYTFHLQHDDGGRLFIGDKCLIDEWAFTDMVWAVGKAALEKGRHALRVEMYEGGGEAGIRFYWTDPAGKRVPVPTEMLGFDRRASVEAGVKLPEK